MDAVSTIRRELNGRAADRLLRQPVDPATYMVEGGSSKDFRKTKAMAYDNPQALHLLLDKLAQSVTSYLNGQILAGARPCRFLTHRAATCRRRLTGNSPRPTCARSSAA